MDERNTQRRNACAENEGHHERLLVDARGAAKLLGISRRSFLTLYNSGKTPEAIRLGRRVL